MTSTFADKFEAALQEMRERDPQFGLRTLARILADGDRTRVESIRRRLHKYRPKGPGGTAETAPTPPTRREIERALGLPVDALAPDEDLVTALSPSKRIAQLEARQRAFVDAFRELVGP